MISKDILRSIVVQQRDRLLAEEELVEREVLVEIMRWMGDPRILILTGVRRCGKSTILKQMIKVTDHYCYVNFEDERFLSFRADEFETLNEVLTEIYGPPETYFFDEVQNVERFEMFVRRLHDQGKKVILTGSNATMLSRELGTRLTGRYKTFEVFPFSFSEYLKLNKARTDENWLFRTETKVEMLKNFEGYMQNGGMPEYLKNNDIEYVRTVLDNILLRDVVVRYDLKDDRPLRELVNMLATNIAAHFTYNSLKNVLGLSNSQTVKSYIQHLQDSFLFFEVQRFSYSLKQQAKAPKKIYVVDPVFYHICGMHPFPNRGRLLENMVYLHLLRNGKKVFYHMEGRECDLIVVEGNKVVEAIQVCLELNDENRERELDGLGAAMEGLGISEGRVLTLDQSDEIMHGSNMISVEPVMQWMLR
jgi:predicted AAA+ superfamily ATPase